MRRKTLGAEEANAGCGVSAHTKLDGIGVESGSGVVSSGGETHPDARLRHIETGQQTHERRGTCGANKHPKKATTDTTFNPRVLCGFVSALATVIVIWMVGIQEGIGIEVVRHGMIALCVAIIALVVVENRYLTDTFMNVNVAVTNRQAIMQVFEEMVRIFFMATKEMIVAMAVPEGFPVSEGCAGGPDQDETWHAETYNCKKKRAGIALDTSDEDVQMHPKGVREVVKRCAKTGRKLYEATGEKVYEATGRKVYEATDDKNTFNGRAIAVECEVLTEAGPMEQGKDFRTCDDNKMGLDKVKSIDALKDGEELPVTKSPTPEAASPNQTIKPGRTKSTVVKHKSNHLEVIELYDSSSAKEDKSRPSRKCQNFERVKAERQAQPHSSIIRYNKLCTLMALVFPIPGTEAAQHQSRANHEEWLADNLDYVIGAICAIFIIGIIATIYVGAITPNTEVPSLKVAVNPAAEVRVSVDPVHAIDNAPLAEVAAHVVVNPIQDALAAEVAAPVIVNPIQDTPAAEVRVPVDPVHAIDNAPVAEVAVPVLVNPIEDAPVVEDVPMLMVAYDPINDALTGVPDPNTRASEQEFLRWPKV